MAYEVNNDRKIVPNGNSIFYVDNKGIDSDTLSGNERKSDYLSKLGQGHTPDIGKHLENEVLIGRREEERHLSSSHGLEGPPDYYKLCYNDDNHFNGDSRSSSLSSCSEITDKTNTDKIRTKMSMTEKQDNHDKLKSEEQPLDNNIKNHNSKKDNYAKVTLKSHRKSSSLPDSITKQSDRDREHSPSNKIYSRRHSIEPQDGTEKVKTKLMSVWNNVKYGWTVKTKTYFRYDTPIFLLGKCYHRKNMGIEEKDRVHRTVSQPDIEKFKQDFVSRIWLTYRRSFPRLSGTHITTDCGWGCMLRSAQMLLAQGLVSHFLGRDWNFYKSQTHEQEAFHRQIIQWFADMPKPSAPFSIHYLVKQGAENGKKPGDWHGPASAAHILKAVMNKAIEYNPKLGELSIYVAQDCTIYLADVIDQCTQRPRLYTLTSSTSSEDNDKDYWRSIIILVPIRLGGEDLNHIYVPCVKSLLANDTCIGIIGGRPKHSLNFVGFQDDKLIYMDPHYCQDVVNVEKHKFPVHSFHCLSPRKMSFTHMDPSCTVGFYLKTRKDLDKFVTTAKEFLAPPMQRGQYPMFIFSEGRNEDQIYDTGSPNSEKYLRIRHLDHLGRERSPTHESEDFVFL